MNIDMSMMAITWSISVLLTVVLLGYQYAAAVSPKFRRNSQALHRLNWHSTKFVVSTAARSTLTTASCRFPAWSWLRGGPVEELGITLGVLRESE